ncbi:MAG: putative small-conductance mechanosensitive ion channel [Ramlibacter sp.]|nr:putative small-conductance mechanosensitive ion channel [Ramlibacter sp.]
MTELDKLVHDLGQPGVPLQLGVLLGCLVLAFGVCWLIGRKHSHDSVWFGRHIVDGLLFPLLALALTYSAMLVLARRQPAPLLKVAVPVLISLAGIRFLARVFRVVFPKSAAARLVETLFSWLAWLAAVLWIVGLLPELMDQMDAIHFTLGKSRISLLGIVQGLLSSCAVMVIALWISSTLEKRVLNHTMHDLSLRKVAATALRSLLLLVGLLFALSAVGVDLTALSVLGGAVGVGLGFGLQKLASNYVSGFVILFERSLRIGDMVKVDNFEGVVTDIKTRYTLIRAPNGREAIIPNEKVITERVENLSLADTRVLLTADVTVGYDSEVGQVKAILCSAASASQRVLKEPAPIAHLAKLGADGLEFSLLFWIEDPANGQLSVHSEVNQRILEGLRAASIEIPFPQRVVHLRNGPDEAATASAKAATS